MICRLSLCMIALTTATALQPQQTPTRVDARVVHSRDSLPAVETNIAMSSSRLSRGDLADLVVTATNHGTERVTIGLACGPSLDVLVQYPDGTERSALWDSVAPQADFDCRGGSSHFADPGQTKAEHISWRIPTAPGTYHLRATLRRSDGLGNLSLPVALTVP